MSHTGMWLLSLLCVQGAVSLLHLRANVSPGTNINSRPLAPDASRRPVKPYYAIFSAGVRSVKESSHGLPAPLDGLDMLFLWCRGCVVSQGSRTGVYSQHRLDVLAILLVVDRPVNSQYTSFNLGVRSVKWSNCGLLTSTGILF